MDFTLSTYKTLLYTLKKQGFSFHIFSDFLSQDSGKGIVLRHDVDKLPSKSLEFARIETESGIRGTYYFRIVPGSLDEKIIKEINSLGHEIGYHYEDVSLAAKRLRAQGSGLSAKGTGEEEELIKIAIDSFRVNLERMRQIVPVTTICMHGSPMSKWDSRFLWKYYDYHDFGIIGEPYFDIDFNKVLYLTDTGRRWDGDSFNIRDKSINRKGRKDVSNDTKSNLHISPSPSLPIFPSFHSTFDIIKAAEQGKLPDKIMMTFHPQRWTDKPLPWVKELIWQNVKNVGKYFLVKIR
jgi:hypothetical protein